MTGCGRAFAARAPWLLRGPCSLGAQSLSDAIRKPLGRDATRAGVVRFLRDLVALDCGAIVIDLIYGLPGQPRRTWPMTCGSAPRSGSTGSTSIC